MLDAKSLTKWFGAIRAVSDVTFTVAAGEVLGYLGPNGSGKTTTVGMLTGLIEPSGGAVFFEGVDIADDPVDYRRHVGYVPEEPHLYPALETSGRGGSERGSAIYVTERGGMSMRRDAPIVMAAALLVTLACSSKSSTPVSPTTPTAPSGTSGMQAEPLRDAARASGKLVGAAVKSSLLSDGRYAGVLGRHFNYLTAEFEMKWDAIERTRDSNNFAAGDAIVAFGQANGMQIKGHALIWHGSVPGWLSALPVADFRAAFEAHIRSVGEHFRGRVVAWDVVNEAIADDGPGLRDTVFRQKLGDQYIADAFRLARQADPQALLFYNDYGGEGLTAKSERIYNLVQGLRAQGVPIDGVGLQMHVNATSPPSDANIAANMRRLVALGLLVNISEMDVRIRDVPGTAQARLDVQKSVYRSIVGICAAEPRCDGVTFWGFTDAYSWIDAQYGADDPLIFDEQYAVKPAYYGVLDALWRR